VQQGLSEERLFVKTTVCGKGLMFKKIDVKGRGRMGFIKVPKCSVKITLEEKHPIEYYKMLLKGECPPGAADLFKQMLHQSEADFDRV
jgi:ssDNA-binding Zn-finger/Zn-ribbon topoisomerase 1